jgi:hypothetical protein
MGIPKMLGGFMAGIDTLWGAVGIDLDVREVIGTIAQAEILERQLLRRRTNGSAPRSQYIRYGFSVATNTSPGGGL